MALLRGGLLRPLTAGDEGRQPFHIAVIAGLRLEVLLPRLEMVRLLLVRLLMLLRVLLFTRKEWLLIARRKRLAAIHRLIAIAVAVVKGVIADIAAHVARLLLLIIGLSLPQMLLRRSDQAKIMLGVLIVVLRRDRIAGALRVTGELKVFFRDMRCGAPDLHVGPI